jgi:hypothetical protein
MYYLRTVYKKKSNNNVIIKKTCNIGILFYKLYKVKSVYAESPWDQLLR